MNVPLLIGTLFIAVPCIIENFVVIVIIAIDRNLHTVTNILIVSMAIADFAVGAINMPLYFVEQSAENQKFVDCMISKCITLTFILSSICHLFLIALDRFIAIIYPLRYEDIMTRHRAVAMVMLLWIVVPFVSLLPLMGWRNQHYSQLDQRVDVCEYGAYASLSYTFLVFSLGYLLPVVTMMVFYCCIFRVAKKHAKRIADINQHVTDRRECDATKRQHRKLVDDSKAAKVLCLVMGCFLLCIMPASISVVVDIATSGGVSNSVAVFTNLFAFSNSALNPIIYTLGTRQTRLAIQRRLGPCFPCLAVRRDDLDAAGRTISHVSSAAPPAFQVVVEDIEANEYE